MKGLKIVYFSLGGVLVLTSAISFMYFILFGYRATIGQWGAASILGTIGSIFMLIGHELEKKR